MLIPYDQLKQSLSAEALTNLMREFLLQQITDQGFDQTDSQALSQALPQVEAALKRGELVVEFSEECRIFTNLVLIAESSATFSTDTSLVGSAVTSAGAARSSAV